MPVGSDVIVIDLGAGKTAVATPVAVVAFVHSVWLLLLLRWPSVIDLCPESL